ncbi:hypothetical protein [Streptomyces sp. NPDC058249]|uniref:hypothetical protein n=1 Tax=Streptomyces sp. NPDC058249 TaxID=3346403 RepID=UPI0036EADFBC
MSSSTESTTRTRLGITPDAEAWCQLGKIPKPPSDIHQAAGAGPLRPAFIRPLGIFGVTLGAPLMFIAWLFSLLASGEEALKVLLSTKEEQERARAKRLEPKQRDEAIVEHGLDKTFDGDWNKAAGQLLLRWYGHSSHHQRFVILAEGRIVLAGPPKRVSIRRESLMRVLAEIPAGEAVIEDPLLGAYDSDRLRVRFVDGSWLTLVTEERRGDLHMYLMRHPQDSEVRDTGA